MSERWTSDYIDVGDFTGLFVEELGWERPSRGGRRVDLDADGRSLELVEAATFRGVSVWTCDSMPTGKAQREVDRKLRKESAERIVIFHDSKCQMWRWPQARDAAGAGSARLVTHEHRVGRPNEALRQRLQFIELGIDEDVTVPEVVRRLHRAFDSDRVTKSFYTQFAEQHRELTSEITGIEVSDDVSKPELRWYGSLLLNRLMFIYFMQRKGFLDNDVDYLRNRLTRIRALDRPGSFFEFYKDFLIPLFHEGLGADTPHRELPNPVIAEILGDLPYINGGLFSEHPLEIAGEIRVPDVAFEKLFDFFDQWQWHLDDRPTGNPNEINPDVLGYIFEQFVNHTEEVAGDDPATQSNVDKGAYYTKEDVTGFMTANSLLPLFLERLETATGVNPWRMLADDPIRYIWPSLKHGYEEPLPPTVAAAVTEWPRPGWTEPVPPEFGLPTESWWEVIDRRDRVTELCQMATNGDLNSAMAVIGANVDLETLAVDVVDSLDSPSDVADCWRLLTELRVIDPTCGSGAFLFAALNIMHTLYSVTFEAAESHLNTTDHLELANIVRDAERHPNVSYYLLKHSAISNLYGVDIMPEAVEIARLRLFLKLISQVEKRIEVEPLPDLEFNIRCGNALVGALGAEQVRGRVDLFSSAKVDELVATTGTIADAYCEFAAQQERGDQVLMLRSKQRLYELGEGVRERLDRWWYDSDHHDDELEGYLVRVRPFHWFVEFPDAFAHGGFDVVIGNPPYVSRRNIDYGLDDLVTSSLPDIYAPCIERSFSILRDGGRLAMITPHSIMQSGHFAPLRSFIASIADEIFCSSFARIPSGLFENNVRVRNTIMLARRSDTGCSHVSSSRCRRWYSSYRPHLMATIKYTPIEAKAPTWRFVDDPHVLTLFERLRTATGGMVENDLARSDPTGGERTLFYKGNAYNYLSVAMEPVPVINVDGSPGETAQQRELIFQSSHARDFAYVLLAGRLGLAWWAMQGDDFDLTKGILASFPGAYGSAPKDLRETVLEWYEPIGSAQSEATVWKLNKGKKIGNWDLSACRYVTDLADDAILDAIGATDDEREALWTFYERIFMSGSE